MCTKLVKLLLIGGVKRRNMINDYLRGKACIEFVRRSLIQREFLSLSFSCFDFELLLVLLCHLVWFVAFSR
jgi:hypothetical protein